MTTNNDNLSFPLTMGPNNRYFVDQNGVPILINGDSPQALLVNLSSSDMNFYMTERKSQGFNTIIVDVLADNHIGGNTNGTTYDGIAPFTSGSSPSDYDLSTPNPTYFARLDAVVSMAAANGFLLFLDPIETIGWLQTLQNNGTSNAFDFGVFLGNRYKDSPNVAWQSGNDFQTWTNTSDSNLVYQVMAGIKSVAPSQIQTIALSFYTSYSNQNAVTLPAINMDAVYTYHETYDMMLQAYNSSPTSPVFLVEGNYEGENVGPFSFPGVTGTFILRAQEYWTMTSGGVGQFYGSFWDWRFAFGWQSSLDSAGVAQLPYWTTLFTSVEWWKLVPDQNHQIVTAGYGTYNANNDNFYTSNYATTAWNPDGTTSVTYDIAGSALTVNLAKFAGPVTAQWYDPTNGTYQNVTDSPLANTSSWVFQPPGENQEGYNDWVLVLHAQTEEAPVITSNGGGDTAAVNVAENGTAVTTVTATDPDAGATQTYSIVGGADQAKFAIDPTTGVLGFVSAPDFEAPADAGTDNVYDVTVQVSDGTLTDTQAIAVTVQDVNEVPGNQPPVITSNGGSATAAVNVAENGTAVTTVTATDIDGGALVYSIAGGADASDFTINAASGVLSFKNVPDFEAPADANHNNLFEVVVGVADGHGATETQSLSVGVANVAGLIIKGSDHDDRIDATYTAPGQLLPTGEEDVVRGGRGDDDLSGLGGNDLLQGGKGSDQLKGGDGDDTLAGRFGKNILTGGDGNDSFVFNSQLGAGKQGHSVLGASSYSKITDFSPGRDIVVLDHSVFKALDPGPLGHGEFHLGKAKSGDDHILYRAQTGAIYYDHDGKGGDDAIQFATLTNKPALSDVDFLVAA